MRDIKFRVWDTELKEYSAFTNRDPMLDLSNNRLVFWERAEKGPDIIQTDASERFVLQQYTGFKDIHGKEIYEGDFVKSKIFEDDDDKQSITGQVKFIKGAFGIQCYEKDAVVEFIYICEFGSLELLDNP